MASADPFSRHYEALTPAERLTLALEAMARGDGGDAQRLHDTCPRKTYSQMDIEFTERMDLAFDTLAAACTDLRCLWGKLQVLEGARAQVSRSPRMHEADASLAFVEGVACGEGRLQMDYFSGTPAPLPDLDAEGEGAAGDGSAGEAAGADGPEEDEVEDDAGEEGEGQAPPRRADFVRRLAAVEERTEHHSEVIDLVLRRATRDLAQQWVDAWAAFDHFCRTRLGVGPLTLLRAWGFPAAGDFEDALRRYAHLTPDEARVREYLACLCLQWDARFGPEKAGAGNEGDEANGAGEAERDDGD